MNECRRRDAVATRAGRGPAAECHADIGVRDEMHFAFKLSTPLGRDGNYAFSFFFFFFFLLDPSVPMSRYLRGGRNTRRNEDRFR